MVLNLIFSNKVISTAIETTKLNQPALAKDTIMDKRKIDKSIKQTILTSLLIFS